MTKKQGFNRRTIFLFWLAVVSIVIASMIYFQQIALLYVIATLALVSLLIIVALADLETVGRDNATF